MNDKNVGWSDYVIEDRADRGEKQSSDTGKIIFKYQMPVKEHFTMTLPRDAEILRVDDADGYFWMWAVVDTRNENEDRTFRAFKTGASMPDDVSLNYIGFCAVYVQMELGLYIFEEIS